MRTKFPRNIVTSQTIGNIGLYYVCYKLSLFGWNVMPTARNAKGIDILIYSQNAVQKVLIQVKTLSKKNPVPLGTKLDNLIGDYVIICVRAHPNEPECFVMTPQELRTLAHRREKDGKVSYWLQPSSYYSDTYKEKWNRIGHGVPLQT
jgi:hypothetical protein